MASTQDESFWVESEDWHTAGEPFRIVSKFPFGLETGDETVARRRLNIMEHPDHPLDVLRRSLCHEPRGHADMYGGFITPPNDQGALFGVLFWHKDGFSTACGHGTIALGYWALAHELLPAPENGTADVVIDVPSGRVVSRMTIKNNKAVHAEFIQVLSYQIAKDISITLSSRGLDINVDMAYSGAVFASIDASQLDIKIEPSKYNEFISLGREIRASLHEQHSSFYDLYAIVFFADDSHAQDGSGEIRQRNVTVFADGQIDRSPCGSGTTSRLAILLSQGRFETGVSRLLHRSIIGTTSFEADIVSEEASPVNQFKGCIPRVRGQANLLGRMAFFIDPMDPVFPGFLLR